MATNGSMYKRLCDLYGRVLARTWRANSELGRFAAARRHDASPVHIEQMEPRLLLSASVGHHLFYNDSAFDSHSAAINVADDAAIAPDKTALQELGQASFANYSSYDKGINGVMIDVDKLPKTPTLSDFVFRTGTDDQDLSNWQIAPNPTGMKVRKGAGVGGSDRIVLTWDDASAVKNAWLQVTVLSTPNTGLYEQDVFYFGSAIGEAGNAPGSTRVDATDMLLARRNTRSLLDPAGIDDPYDFNRNAKVDATDLLIARRNQTNFATDLPLVSAPLNPVDNLRAEVYSASEVRLSWQDRSQSELGYRVLMASSESGEFSEVATTGPDATAALLTELPAGVSRWFRVEPIAPASMGTPETATPTIRVDIPERLNNIMTDTYWAITVTGSSITRGEAGYTGTGTASVSCDNIINGYGVVAAESAEAAVWLALDSASNKATITDNDSNTRDYVISSSGAYKVGTASQLEQEITETRNGGFDRPSGVEDDDWLLVLEDTYEWTNIDLDYDDFYWLLEVHQIPDVINSTSTNDDPDEDDGTPWTGEFIEDDSGEDVPEITLRSFIEYTNAEATAQIASFDIPTADPGHADGIWTISESNLPTVTNSLKIEADTQPGFEDDPVIVLSGSGLTFTANNCGVDSMTVIGFSAAGLLFQNADGATTVNCFLGVAPDGTGTGGEIGLHLNNATNSTHEDLVIGNNSVAGVKVEGTSSSVNTIQSSKIGTDKAGTAAKANNEGIWITGGASDSIIGTDGDGEDDASEGNLISGNSDNGVRVDGSQTYNTYIAGNDIGINAAGTAALENGENGVLISGGATYTIVGTDGDGQSDDLEWNVISGNGSNGVRITGADTRYNYVAGNNIGTDAAGTTDIGNSANGVLIDAGADTNVIGTDGDGSGDADEWNLISGNDSDGVEITGSGTDDNIVAGNIIGTNFAGTAALKNYAHGVVIAFGAQSNRVGTDGDGQSDDVEGNLISGNGWNGVDIDISGSNDNIIAGNLIGTNLSGTDAVANGWSGVSISGSATGNIIGTNGDGTGDDVEGNLISGNDSYGIKLGGADSNSNVVAGNIIGLKANGTEALGNGHDGVRISYSDSNRIGTNGDGTSDEEERNIISGNGSYGVSIVGGEGNTIAGNYIGTNEAGTDAVKNDMGGINLYGTDDAIIGVDGDGSAGEASEGNVISGNDHYGIGISGPSSDGHIIAGNYIGTNHDGTDAIANEVTGIEVSGYTVTNLRIGTDGNGTSDALERNVISGNGRNGISAWSVTDMTNIRISGNYIGTNAAGTAAIANGWSGISVTGDTANWTIGTDGSGDVNDASERNVISGNGYYGIELNDDETEDVTIAGNYIGTNSAGTASLANSRSGLYLAGGAHGNRIGTDADGTSDAYERNIISGNNWAGIDLYGEGTDSNIVAGNYIGTAVDGTSPIANGTRGIYIDGGAQSNTVGSNSDGTRDAVEGNVIAFNTDEGVYVKAGTENAIRMNSIFENGELGIDLGTSGITANDNEDTDNGANDLQNRPYLSAAEVDVGNNRTTIAGSLNSTPSTTFRIEFYGNNVDDENWHLHGRTFLDAVSVNTDGNGDASFSRVVNQIAQNVTAIAIDPDGNTSEFGWPIRIEYLPTGQGTTGELDENNPDRTGGTPSFQGGYRIFPDAADYSTRTVSRNVVRIRAILPPGFAGETVYFRVFDVDDPSTSATIDTNGGDGNDNRGTFTDADCDAPGPSNPNGYRGQLREVGAGSWEAEGTTLGVTATAVGSEAHAEVELAVTFAPGDNFRVVVSYDQAEVQGLNDTTDVPTSGVIDGFGGAASDQLSVWRRFHVEQDTMATTTGDTQNGNITASTAPAGGQVTVTTNITVTTANEYVGGILRTGGVNYAIVSNTSGANAQVTVTSGAALANGAVDLYQDDWGAVGNNAPTTRADTTSDAHVYDWMQPTTVRADNRYADAYLLPEYDALNAFDSNNVTAQTHGTGAAHFTPFWGGTGGPADYETDLFWSVCFSTAFEYLAGNDDDPATEPATAGISYVGSGGQVGGVYVETCRDLAIQGADPNVGSYDEYVARTAVHEIGHQFGLAVNGDPGDTYHRNNTAMDSWVGDPTNAQFYFAAEELVALRNRYESPGT